jgi:hypothetical protein
VRWIRTTGGQRLDDEAPTGRGDDSDVRTPLPDLAESARSQLTRLLSDLAGVLISFENRARRWLHPPPDFGHQESDLSTSSAAYKWPTRPLSLRPIQREGPFRLPAFRFDLSGTSWTLLS